MSARTTFSNRLRRWLGVLPVAALAWPGIAQPVADGTSSSAKPETKTVVVLGDSLAAGYGLDQSEAFPARLQKLINEAGWNFTVVNAGVSGDTSAGGLRRIDWVLKRRVDVLLLELGANDGLRGIPVEVTRTNLQAIVDRTRKKYPEVRVVMAGMQMPPNMGEEYNGAFQKIFPQLAQANHAVLIPFLLEGVGGNAALNQPDRIHPTVEGHNLVAQNIWKPLQPLLQEMSREQPKR